MKSIHKIALDLMGEGVPFACASVTSREGSIPGADGAKMLITAQKAMARSAAAFWNGR
jgi:xanthine/CO dehydrogenase XdhC/CoxF family maturation factor